jgi:hypothetical protein
LPLAEGPHNQWFGRPEGLMKTTIEIDDALLKRHLKVVNPLVDA